MPFSFILVLNIVPGISILIGMKRHGIGPRGQSQIIGVVLLTLIMIVMIGVTYMWGMPLVEKQKDTVRTSNAEKFVRELDDRIKDVAKNGGTQRIEIPSIPGELRMVDQGVNDKIELETPTTGTDIATGIDIYLRGDERDEVSIGNEPGVIKILSTDLGGNSYRFDMTLYYRNLTGSESVYMIDLRGLGRDMVSGEGHSVIVSEGGEMPVERDGSRSVYTTVVNLRFE